MLPEDTRLEENHAYDMVMLANPRGHKLGKIIAGDNTVLLPVWGITEGASTVYLRHNDPAKAHPSFDLEIPCTAKTIERGGIKWLELRPVDPETDLAKLARVRNLDGLGRVDVKRAAPHCQRDASGFSAGWYEESEPNHEPDE